MCDTLLAQDGFSPAILRITVGVPAGYAAGRIGIPAPEKLEAFAMPTDEGFGRHDGQGVSRVEASAEPHEGQAGGIVESARPDFAFLIEGELFAQEEILGGKRGLERKPGPETKANHQTGSTNSGKVSSSDDILYFRSPPLNWSLFCGFQASPVIFAEHRDHVR